MVGVKVQVPAAQVAVPFWVLVPVIATETGRAVTDRAATRTAEGRDSRVADVRERAGGAVDSCERDHRDRLVDGDRLRTGRADVARGVALGRGDGVDAVRGERGGGGEGPCTRRARAVPFCVLAPAIAIETVGLTPAAVVHVPPSVVTVVLVMNGNVRAVPFTVVIATTGAAVLMVIDCAPLVPVFAAVSVCVAVTLYVPLAARVGAVVYVHTPTLTRGGAVLRRGAGDRDGDSRGVAGGGTARSAHGRDTRVRRVRERAYGAVHGGEGDDRCGGVDRDRLAHRCWRSWRPRRSGLR